MHLPRLDRTPGAIARPYGDGWFGVYHDLDSYPSGLGATLWRLRNGGENPFGFTTFPGIDTTRLLEEVIDRHLAGWSHLYPGLRTDHLSDPKCAADPLACLQNHGEYSACFCHDPYGGHLPDEPIVAMLCGTDCETGECTPTFIKWVYILHEATMTILATRQTDKWIYDEIDREYRFALQHVPIVQLNLDGPEPDWAELDTLGEVVSFE